MRKKIIPIIIILIISISIPSFFYVYSYIKHQNEIVRIQDGKNYESSAWINSEGEMLLFNEDGLCLMNDTLYKYKVDGEKIIIKNKKNKKTYSYKNNDGKSIVIDGVTYKRTDYCD